ncbi:MAG: two-component regulator propeller domain-containing protein, partial [Acidobacteriota bacterium]
MCSESLQTADSIGQFTVRDGLSQITIRELHQDRRGFLWVATGDGLNRFDGFEFKVYRHRRGDPTSLPGNEVMSILEDRDDVLWFGTRSSGVARWDRSLDRFLTYRHDPQDPESLADDRVVVLTQTRDGLMWIGTQRGLTRLNPQTGEIGPFRGEPRALAEAWITGLWGDSKGALWVSTAEDLFRIGAAGAVESFADRVQFKGVTHPRVFLEEASGVLWVSGWPGLLRVDLN